MAGEEASRLSASRLFPKAQFGIVAGNSPGQHGEMHVEKLKYLIWAQDMGRAVRFYREVFEAEVVRQSDIMAELTIAGSTVGIHSGGEGKRTWTGMTFQIGDLFAACDALLKAGGTVIRPPEDTPEEPAHLAMCADPEGNEIMLSKARHR